MRDGTRNLSFCLLLLAAIIGIVAFAYLPWWTVDDAYISYRYGRNLLTDGELTWNVGAPRVEGYTGIFLPLLTATLLGLGLPLVNGIKVLGIAALLSIIWLLHATLRRLGVPLLARSLTVLLLAAAPILYEHSISGLETIFFTAALSLVWWALADAAALLHSGRSATALGIGLLCAGVCRPEGIALGVIVLILLALHHRQFNGLVFRDVMIRLVVLAAAPLLSYWVWRTVYYGSWLPNTFAAKAYSGWINLDSVLAFGKFIGYYIFIPACCAVILAGKGSLNRIRSQKLLLGAGAAMLACCLVAYGHSHLWMNYGSRFFFPFLPFLLTIVASIIPNDGALPSLRGRKMVLVTILVCMQLGVMAYRFRQEAAFLNYYHWIVQDELIPVGEYLKRTAPPGATVISFMDAGAIGYYSALPIIDFGRLNDRYLVDPGLDVAAIKDYFFDQGADYVVMSSAAADAIAYTDEAMAIIADQRFARYVRVGVWANRVHYPYWQHVFRQDSIPLQQ